MSDTHYYNDYDFIQDGLTGETCAVRTDTGEVFAAQYIPVVEGSYIISPVQQERSAQKKERAEKKLLRRTPQGKEFYFARCSERFSLSPETITRLLYLMTYAGHAKNGYKLLLNNRMQMHKEDLPEVLFVSRGTANKFYDEVSPLFVQESETGLHWTKNNGWLHKGALYMRDDLSYTRIFCNAMREMYKGAKGKIKYLGYVFQMLPYINREHNILCWNPQEKDRQKIETMNLIDVCGLVGFDNTHIERLFERLAEQEFEIDGRTEWLFRLFNQPNSNDYRKAVICINPCLIYAGSDPDSVDYMRTKYN